MRHARCPACQTLFRVTEEQLEARGGRVRCGQCAHVFNALEEPMVGLVPASDLPGDQDIPPPEHWPDEPSLHQLAAEPSGEAASAFVAEPAPEPVISEMPPALPENEEQETAPAPLVADWADDRPELQLPPPVAGQGGAGWMLAFGVLAFAAVLQGLWVFRAEVAMAVPELRPQLVSACESLGCDMPLPKESAQIGIEGSELRPSPQGATLLKLSATLRNRAAFAQAYPHLELTLTDTDDKALARRVVPPADYLAPKVSLPAGFPANSDLPISLTLDPSNLSPAGYRLYVFYP